jgi:hypothetical protein
VHSLSSLTAPVGAPKRFFSKLHAADTSPLREHAAHIAQRKAQLDYRRSLMLYSNDRREELADYHRRLPENGQRCAFWGAKRPNGIRFGNGRGSHEFAG